MNLRSGIARVNGTELYFEILGNGPDIVLLHGFSLDCRMWDEQFEAFAVDHRVLRYDLRGFGRSAAPNAEPYTPAADLRALLETLEIARTSVIGLSMGGGFALDFALEYPELTAALIAADSALAGFDWPHGRPSAWHAELAVEQGVEAAKAAWLECALFRPAAEQRAVADRLHDMVRDYSGWHWLNPNPITPPDIPALQRLGAIQCPTLVLVGERDEADFHTVGRLLADDIPGATLVTLEAAGHMSNMEKPAAFNDAVRAFLP